MKVLNGDGIEVRDAEYQLDSNSFILYWN